MKLKTAWGKVKPEYVAATTQESGPGVFLPWLALGVAGGFLLNIFLDYILSNTLLLFLLPLILIALIGSSARSRKTKNSKWFFWGVTIITIVLTPLYGPLIGLGLYLYYGFPNRKWWALFLSERRALGAALLAIIILGFAFSIVWSGLKKDYNWRVHVIVVDRQSPYELEFFSADDLTREMRKILVGIPASEYRRPKLGAPDDRQFLNGFTVELTEEGLEALNEGGYNKSAYVESLYYEPIKKPMGQSIPLIPGSLRHCWTNRDCVSVSEGCCSCSSGGRNTVINRKYLYTWGMGWLFPLSNCLCFGMISNHWTCWAEPKCVDRTCVLIERPRELPHELDELEYLPEELTLEPTEQNGVVFGYDSDMAFSVLALITDDESKAYLLSPKTGGFFESLMPAGNYTLVQFISNGPGISEINVTVPAGNYVEIEPPRYRRSRSVMNYQIRIVRNGSRNISVEKLELYEPLTLRFETNSVTMEVSPEFEERQDLPYLLPNLYRALILNWEEFHGYGEVQIYVFVERPKDVEWQPPKKEWQPLLR